MGMSASQARFLSLTARKTNVEYEGQQINQQRTTLSNESSNYYSQLTSMAVPVPPSTADYTKVTYTFADGTEKNTVTSIVATKDTKATGVYMLNYVQEIPANNIVANGTSVVTKTGSDFTIGTITLQDAVSSTGVQGADGKYYVKDGNKGTATKDTTANKYFIQVNPSAAEQTAGKMIIPSLGGRECAITRTAGGNWICYLNDVDANGKYDTYKEATAEEAGFVDDDNRDSIVERFIAAGIPTEVANQYSNKELGDKLKVEAQYKAMATEKYSREDWKVKYVKNPATGSYDAVFYSTKDLENTDYNEKTGASLTGVRSYAFGETTESREIKNVRAKLEQDATGRYQALFIYDDYEKDQESGTRYELTTTTESDDAAYNDAMNQYFYDKAKYDQKVQEINAKIEIIQVQDKNLELKLKQLDTEQNAISTEMDAVKKVISKNVESSFKTFNA